MVENILEKSKEILFEDRESKFFDCFLAGYGKSGTCLSSRRYFNFNTKENVPFTDSHFRIIGATYGNKYDIGSMEKFDVSAFLYFTSGLAMGISYIPFDFVHTFGRNIYDSFDHGQTKFESK